MMGFKFKVLADSLYGESDSNFVSVCAVQLDFVVTIRNHDCYGYHKVKVRYNQWRPYNRIFSDGKQKNGI